MIFFTFKKPKITLIYSSSKFLPTPSFDSFFFLLSIGTSRSILVAWKSFMWSGTKVFQNNFTISSFHNNSSWVLSIVYGPCFANGKRDFLVWFGNNQMPNDLDWLVIGDFNLIQKADDINRTRGNFGEMLLFNEAINSLGRVKQAAPLFWKDWIGFFT